MGFGTEVGGDVDAVGGQRIIGFRLVTDNGLAPIVRREATSWAGTFGVPLERSCIAPIGSAQRI